MYFIRHGQSEFNAAFNATGQDPNVPDAPLTATGQDPNVPDAPLTATGQEQARTAGHLLLDKKITHIISSPYCRALQTTAILNETLHCPVTVTPFVGERALYSCDIGTPISELKKQWPDYSFDKDIDEKWWPKSGETENALALRRKAFLASVAGNPNTAQTLVVSHWYFLFGLSGLDAENCSVLWRDGHGRFHKQS